MASSSIAHFNPSRSPNYGFIIPNAPSPNMRALLAYLNALQEWNFKDVMACFDEALEHRILPQSLGRPVLNKRQYGEYFGAIMPLMKKSQVLRST
jgi:ABC-type phosphate transport system auxiliary subunit